MSETCIYTAESIQVLDMVDAVRRRPGMYIGDTRDGSGLHHLLWEVVANALDEHLAGRASKIRVSVESNLAEVEDNGRGIPVETLESGSSALERILTTLHCGPTRDGHLPHVHISPQGVGLGLGPVNALCEELEVQVWRAGFSWTQRYARGRAQGALERGARTERTGTRVRIIPDSTLFASTRFDAQAVREHLRDIALWNPRLTFDFMSQPISEPRGTVAWLERLAAENGVPCSTDPFVTRATREGTWVEVAAAWSNEPAWDLRSFVGQHETEDGGSHVTGFWQGLTDALAGRNPGLFRGSRRGARWRRALAPGLIGVVHVGLGDARFAGPTRDRLESPEAREAVRAELAEAFSRHLAAHSELEARLVARVSAG